MNKLIRAIKDPNLVLYKLLSIKILGFRIPMSDEKYLKWRFKNTFKRELDLVNPKSYNEKLQWLKLYDRKPQYTEMVDKDAAKKYVASIIGDEYIIPTLETYDSVEQLDFSKLPQQFVLKCTHDSGTVVVVTDKTKINENKVKRKLKKALKKNYYYASREWPYKDIKPRIIAEKYMIDKKSNELKDYKFFCFKGEPKALFVASDRSNPNEETKFDFYDMDFNKLDFTNGHPNSVNGVKKPETFEKMKELSRVLSKDLPHIRVDFYDVNGQIYFGELTFYHWSGLVPFEPEEWDYKFGEWIELPQKSE